MKKRARKFAAAHPELKPRLAAVLRHLESDPAHPSLRLHPLRGALAGVHAVRINYAYRITLTLLLKDREIHLLDIGSHDAVYR